MRSLEAFAEEKLKTLERAHLRRALMETAHAQGPYVVRDGRLLLSFSSNDYLGFADHPAIKQAAIRAIEQYGLGAGASRLVTGNHPLYAELERRLAQLKGTEAACVFGSGYLANTGIIPALVSRDDLIVIDELAHACLVAGSRLSGARVAPFRHNDVEHARTLLADRRTKHPHALIVTDGVFSMDGDLARLPGLAVLAQEFDCWLMSDDAHGIGVVGGGRGSTFAFDPHPAVPLQMGTLSKAIGSYGGYLCASRAIVDLMCNRARTLIYATGLPPACLAAAIAALDIIEHDPDYAALPVRKARQFTRALNLPDAQSPIVPVLIGDPEAALAASKQLENHGFLVVAIRPPTVPAGTARLRIAFSAIHQDNDIKRLANAVRPYVKDVQAAAALPFGATSAV